MTSTAFQKVMSSVQAKRLKDRGSLSYMKQKSKKVAVMLQISADV